MSRFGPTFAAGGVRIGSASCRTTALSRTARALRYSATPMESTNQATSIPLVSVRNLSARSSSAGRRTSHQIMPTVAATHSGRSTGCEKLDHVLHECGHPHVGPEREHDAQQNQGGKSPPRRRVASRASPYTTPQAASTVATTTAASSNPSTRVFLDKAHDWDDGEQKGIDVSDPPGHSDNLPPQTLFLASSQGMHRPRKPLLSHGPPLWRPVGLRCREQRYSRQEGV